MSNKKASRIEKTMVYRCMNCGEDLEVDLEDISIETEIETGLAYVTEATRVYPCTGCAINGLDQVNAAISRLECLMKKAKGAK